ncbi:MAG: hypothetical protein EA409_12940 [Saprospirales bacterium]|nr:MAG: hypothetical protein EA409_12940 [Saprospirales bacterium]
MLRIFFFIAILSASYLKVVAQDLNIQVMVQPPYSLNISDYLEKGNNVLILVTNTSISPQEFKLIPSIEGNNGVYAAVKDEFQPLSPIVMGPGETRTFTFNQLRSVNNNLGESDLILSGISLNPLKEGGVLPEGMYTLCVKALQYQTGQLISGSPSCAIFNITSYDPPIILIPQNGAEVMMPQPQIVNFQWTPSGISGKTRYTIRIVDMSMVNVFNPNDAFDNPNIPPYFEQSGLIATAFSYDMSKPKLFYEREYAVQVIAYDPLGETSYKNFGRSQAHVFTIKPLPLVAIPIYPVIPGTPPGGGIQGPGDFTINPGGGSDDDDPGIQPDLDDNDVADCMSAAACSVSEPGCENAVTPSQGAVVKVGKFLMTIDQIQGGNGSGNIFIAHLNSHIEVSFNNLQVNGNGEVCGAPQIWASGHANLIPENLLKDYNGTYDDKNLNWPEINTYIHGNNKKTSHFHPMDPPQKVPFNLDFGAEQLTVLGIIFTPTAAYANLATSATIPLAGNVDLFSFGGKGICIRPNGFGISEAEGRFSLSHDLTMKMEDKYSFLLEGGEGGSFVVFNCKGIKELKLKGKVEFDRKIILPVAGNEKVVPGPTKFSISFDGNFSNWDDWMIEAETSHPMFTSTQADGFKMGFESIVLDFSRTKNPDNTHFPENHPYANQPVKNDWTGFVLNKPVLKFPEYLKKSDNSNIEVNISNIVMDNEGLWLHMDIENILAKTSEGSLGGWGFSITNLNLDIRKSMLQGGGLEGDVNLPITEAGFAYNAAFEAGDGQNSMKINFGILLQDEVEVDMIFAKFGIEENSTFEVEIENGKVMPSALLHGSIEIGWDNNSEKKPGGDEADGVSSLSFPRVDYQGLKIYNDELGVPKVSLESMQLSNINQQGLLANFPIKVKGNPAFQNYQNGEIGFHFELEFTLTKDNENGFSAETEFTIFAKYSPEKKRYVFDRIQLNCIGLDVDVAVAQIKGQICIFRDDPVFGDGFSGKISADIKGLGFKASMALQIGTVDNYDYFYFEAQAKSAVGIPISTSMSLYGFGGGFYYNMSRTNKEVTTLDGYDNVEVPTKPSPGYSPSNLVYTPSKGGIGFHATVVFGLTGGPSQASAFNGDLTFSMDFSKSNGIEKMGLYGNGYGMQPLLDRGDASIHGFISIEIDFIAKSFELTAGLEVEVADGIVSGSALINMHASAEEWWIHIGSWEAINPLDYKPWADNSRVNLNVKLGPIAANFNLYFMMGSNMPDLPPLPGILLANMQGQGGAPIKDSRTGHGNFNANTPGFGFGAGFHRKLEFEALIFYADIEFFAGFDVLLKNYSNVPGCEAIGINGWFAKGQAFAYLKIEAGLDLDLWFYEGKFKVLDIGAGAVLYAEFPNPNYVRAQVFLDANILNGLITVKKNVRYEIGQKMQCGDLSNPFGDLPIVSEIYPESGEEIEVYEDIRVAFNYPRTIFQVFNELEPEEDPRSYYYKIVKVELKKGNNQVDISDAIYSNDGYTAKFTTKNRAFLPENSQLKYKIVVHGFEAVQGNNHVFLVEEEHLSNFNTKDRPDHISDSQLLASRPHVRQRYFLKDDHPSGFAEPYNGQNYAYLFDKSQIGDPEVFDQSKTEYIAQFTEMGSGNVYEMPASWHLNRIQFGLPDHLKNETMYKIRLIARLQYKPEPKEGHKFQHGNKKANKWETGTEMVEIVEGAYKMNKYLLEDNSPKTFDHSLLKTQWYFKTSKYNRLQNKLAEYSHAGTTHTEIISNTYIPRIKKQGNNYAIKTQAGGGGINLQFYKVPVVLVTGKEAFDVYDLYGYNYGDQYHTVHIPALMDFMNPNAAKSHHDAFYDAVVDRFTYISNIWPAFKPYFAQHFGDKRNWDKTYFKDLSLAPRIKKIWLPNQMSGGASDRIFQYYSKYWHGIGNLALPSNFTVWKPHGPLTQEEINQAINGTQQQGIINLQNVQLQILVPPQQQGGGIKGNQNIKNINTPVYPLVNLSDYLAIADYSNAVTYVWWQMNPSNKYMVYEFQENYLLPKLWRDKGNYSMEWGNLLHNSSQKINYTWGVEKPKLNFNW